MTAMTILAVAAALSGVSGDGGFPVPAGVVSNAFAGRAGALVLVDCASGRVRDYTPASSAERLPPCSTFKIWNALIGGQEGILTTAAAPFYRWDGTTRPIAEWNRDLTLAEAFRVSCVPAFQELARKIGAARMQAWLARVGYGNLDLSAGVDVFWLPGPGRRTLLISPMEQALLMRKLAEGTMPFSPAAQDLVKELMTVSRSERGVLRGKTGSGADATGQYVLGWFVGYVESERRKLVFACALKGDRVMGKDARALVETVLKSSELL